MCRITAACVALVSLASLVLQYIVLVRATWVSPGPALATLRFFSYFTILSNVMVVLVACAAALTANGFWTRASVRGGVALYIGVTGLVYFFVLRHLWQPQGWQWWADTGLHYATPVLYLAWWMWAAPHARLPWRSVGTWLWFPFGYFIWTLLRGAWLGEYPYPFIDAGALGYGHALLNAIGVLCLFLIAGSVIVAIDRRLARGATHG